MKLYVGNIVRLKSFGPMMTVVSQPQVCPKDGVSPVAYVDCMWFDENRINEGTFPAGALEKIAPKDD